MQLRCRLLSLSSCLVFALGAVAQGPAAPSFTEKPDKYLWLEDVNGVRATAWVKAENERSAKVLEADPHFDALDAAALKVLESPSRLPEPDQRRGMIYNTWQDAEHVRGILRKTTLEDYQSAAPHWHTVLDYDALAAHDKQEWVQHGLNCLYPGDGLCLAALSVGGEDADTLREFDLKTESFVPGGFVLPHSKQDVSWIDKDTLLVGRDWGAGTMTKSGYPFVIKLWKRGQPLEAAKEIFRGTEDDVRAGAFTLNDGQGNQVTLIGRALNFFETEYMLWNRGTITKLTLPLKSEPSGLLDNQLIVTLNQDWKPEGLQTTFPQGSVVAIDMAAATRDPAHLKPTAIFTPSAIEFEQQVVTTKNRLLVTTLENVQGRAYVYTRDAKGAWTHKKLDVPDNTSVGIVSVDSSNDEFFLHVDGFLTPPSLLLGDAQTTTLKTAKMEPAQFDASNDVVEQRDATSKDGTRIPYFVVHRKDLKLDGSNPTLMTAYGGFQASMTPHYSAVTGKLWLERGGVYVLANIRGGGEFGPAWHEAGLKTHRQRIYDDFSAVAEDLISTKITSPRRLGIVGGSNGGLLMGVEFNQHPELYRAVVIQVPLLDMLRFEEIAAGASWVGEYGSVSVPEERTFLASISPYNQLRPGVEYPEPLIFTTTRDDRVGPVHARKFAARMEELHYPFFYEEIVEGGHAAGANLKERAKTSATEFTYLTRKLMD